MLLSKARAAATAALPTSVFQSLFFWMLLSKQDVGLHTILQNTRVSILIFLDASL